MHRKTRRFIAHHHVLVLPQKFQMAFLGLASTQDVTWGTNLFWAQNGGALMIGAWWAFVPSGLAVALVAFGLALINYGMDEITNPRLQAESIVRRVAGDLFNRSVRATPVVPRTHEPTA